MGFTDLIRRQGADIALAALAFMALALGGGAALSGAELFAAGLLPGAQAEPRPHDFARLAVSEPFAASRYSPQVLFPVTAAPIPEWLAGGAQAPLFRLTPPAPAAASRRPVIAICIDDLGEDLAGTDRAMALPRAVALSFLPFADATPALAAEAERRGHAVLAHVPMQALGGGDPGPMALTVGMAPDEIARRTEYALDRVLGAAGINNHEGSRFTADAPSLVPVMRLLAARHLFFFDSRTGAGSAVAAAAEAAGVASAPRDIFLDDDPRPEAVTAALDDLARQARKQGVAIAIGHPHEVTLKQLAAWLAQEHGVTLVPLPEAIRREQLRGARVASR